MQSNKSSSQCEDLFSWQMGGEADGQRRAQRLVSPANHAQHVSEHVVNVHNERTVRQRRV